MKAPFPSFTAEWHNDTYNAISPTNPSLSVKGKVIIVTGGGAGIGRETAKAYAEAGAAQVAILGRTQKTLLETKSIIEAQSPATKVTTHIVDVADEEAVGKTASEIGAWDVLILNAGVGSAPTTIEKSNLGYWWRAYETNVKGVVVCAQAFLPLRKPSASIIGINAGMINVPVNAAVSGGHSAYTSSKMAQLKVVEYLAAEVPDAFVSSVHPGVVETDLMRTWDQDAIQTGTKNSNHTMPIDDVKLPAHFILWMTSPEAQFLHGKFVWCNWDVEQLKARAKEIQESQILTSNVLGWPFEPQA
ncbi:MAG: hypothetical protein Q9195_006014 [Heterodermia aff. obscurata]